MKKLLLTFAGIIALQTTNHVNAQAVEEGNFNITVQYGFPDFYKAVIKRFFQDPEYSELQISGFGPIGIRAEYMVADKIGIGLLVNYTNTKVAVKEGTSYVDTAGNVRIAYYNYELKLNRLRIMPRFAFHFGNSDKFDGYFGVAAGYYNANLTYTTDDPNDNNDFSFSNLTPFAFRLDVGGNYYFTDNIGLNFEIGVGGGPLVNLGVAMKF